MKITTDQLKSLMGAEHALIPPMTLCNIAGAKRDNERLRVKYGAVRMRLKGGGSLYPEEEEALGEALASFLLEHLGLTLIDAKPILDLIAKQAKWEDLWFKAEYISEDVLQQELRKLHAVVEEGLGR